MVKSRYVAPVDPSFLSTLLDDMDVRDPSSGGLDNDEDIDDILRSAAGGDASEGHTDWDVNNHPVWQQASLVPETTLKEDEMNALLGDASTSNVFEYDELAAHIQDIEHCFNPVENPTLQDTVAKLQTLNNSWSKHILSNCLPQLNADIVQVL